MDLVWTSLQYLCAVLRVYVNSVVFGACVWVWVCGRVSELQRHTPHTLFKGTDEACISECCHGHERHTVTNAPLPRSAWTCDPHAKTIMSDSCSQLQSSPASALIPWIVCKECNERVSYMQQSLIINCTCQTLMPRQLS